MRLPADLLARVLLAQTLRERNTLARAVAADASDEELGGIAALLDGGKDDEADVALRVLGATSPKQRQALNLRAGSGLVPQLVRICREQYPRGSGPIAFNILRSVDKEAAERLFLNDLDLRKAIGEQPSMVIADLASLGSPASLGLLRKLATETGSVGSEASLQLRILGHMDPAELERLAASWKRHRSPELLSQLYHAYVSTLKPGRSRLGDVTRILGKPDRRERSMVFYTPTGEMALSIEVDSGGRIVSLHLA